MLRPLGKTALQIPPIVFGATTLGNLFREVPEVDKAHIVEQWIHSGLSTVVIDSAGKYGAGLSLEVIGRELERLGVEPNSVLISNKLAWRRVPLTTPEPTFEPGAWFGLQHDAVQDISYDGILRCWEEGNRLLGKYSAQLVSVHDPDEYLAAASDSEDRRRRLSDIVEAYRALHELKAAGQIAAIGVGAKNWKIIQELDQHCALDWVMFANSFTIMHHPAELIQFMNSLAARYIGIINSALFHGGFLLGGRFFDYRSIDPHHPLDQQRLAWRQRFVDTCAEVGQSPFDVGVAFGRSHPAITAVALSSSRAERVPEHVLAATRVMPGRVWDTLRERGLIAGDLPFL
jgi:D-threo-aldose 1-dehydrogenase